MLEFRSTATASTISCKTSSLWLIRRLDPPATNPKTHWWQISALTVESPSMAKKPPSQSVLDDFISEHFAYEVDMLRTTLALLDGNPQTQDKTSLPLWDGGPNVDRDQALTNALI